MEMNILWIIVVLILAAGAVSGFKKGLVEGVVRLISCVIGMLVLIVLVKGIGSFIQGSVLNVLMALILLAGIRIVHSLVKLLLDSCKLVSRLPVIHWLDKVAGTALGLAESVCLIWIGFLAVNLIPVAAFAAWIDQQVQASTMLTLLYHSNYVVTLMQII